jgi:hypothetical protein
MPGRSHVISFLILDFAMSILSIALFSCNGTVSNHCTPQCDGLQCGDDKCGGNCGLCDDPAICQEGQCVVPGECRPPCDVAQCQVCAHQACVSRCFGTEVCNDGICEEPICDPPCDGNTRICSDSVCKTFAELKNEYIGSHPGQAVIPYPWEPITSTRVLPFDYEVPAAPGNVVSISACRDEFEAASFVITAQKDLSGIAIDVPNLVDAQGNTIPSSAIDVRIVKVWYQAAENSIDFATPGCFLAPELLLKDDGLVSVNYDTKTNYLKVTINGSEQTIDISNPDAVFPSNAEIHDAATLQPFSLKANENKQIWVTVHVPSNAPSGDYYGMFTLSAPSETPVNMNFGVRVLPFDLEPSPLEYAICYRGMLSSGTTNGINSEWKTPAQYSLELQNMKEHGISYPTMYQEEDDQFGPALLLRNQSRLPTDHVYILNAVRASTISDPAAINAMVVRLQAEQNIAHESGFNKIYVFGLDEVSGATLTAERPSMIAFKNAGAGLFIAGYGDAAGLVGDIVDVGNIAGAMSTAQAAQWHSYGNRIFSYANPQIGVENPAIYRRNYGFALWNAGYDGAMNYAYQHSYGHIWNDYDSADTHYRDHVFAYPTSNGVIDTIEWEGFRNGVDDLRYLATLMKKKGGDDTLARLIVEDSLSRNESMSTIRKKLIKKILSDECFGAEECNSTGNPIGGGAGYSDIITENDPRVIYVASTKDQLLTQLASANLGEVIYVPETANIDLTGIWGTNIPERVTLASNRGYNGSAGGRIFTMSDQPAGWGASISMLVVNGNNVRITGLRLEGDETSKVFAGYEGTFGIFSYGFTGVEVDNNEIWGFGQADVTEGMYDDAASNTIQKNALAATEIGSTIMNVHHNFLHHSQIEAEGYGVNVVRGSALVKANLFDTTRHAIAAGGYDWEGYEATYNVYIGSNAYSHIFDVHGQNGGMGGIAGNTYRIVHNTFLSNTSHAIFIRGVPINDVLITLNRMNNCYETTGDLCWGDPPNAVQQYNSTGNITMFDNMIDGVYVSGPQILNEVP